ncbi:MAG: nuclear transport factor 2 family protein [Nitrospinota bacterium]|nr:nuclear transport factor 2 family protein [Nitrospinota bacterium]
MQKKTREGFNYFNRRDIDAIMANWAEDGVLIYPGKVSASGRFTGKSTIRKWYEDAFAQFPKLVFTVKHVMVENIWDMTGNNVIAVSYDIDTTNTQGMENHASAVNLSKIRNGKLIEMQVFMFGSREEIDAMAARGEGDTPKIATECPWDKDKA